MSKLRVKNPSAAVTSSMSLAVSKALQGRLNAGVFLCCETPALKLKRLTPVV